MELDKTNFSRKPTPFVHFLKYYTFLFRVKLKSSHTSWMARDRFAYFQRCTHKPGSKNVYTHFRHATVATYAVLATRDAETNGKESGRKISFITEYIAFMKDNYNCEKLLCLSYKYCKCRFDLSLDFWHKEMFVQSRKISRRNFLCQRAFSSSLLVNLENE